MDRTCTVEGCPNAHRAKGFCSTHYNQRLLTAPRYAVATVACAMCGAPTDKQIRNDRKRRYCSLACRDDFKFGADRLRFSRELVHVALPTLSIIPPRHPARTFKRNKPRKWVSGACAWCGEWFTFPDQITSRYCSGRCASGASDARRGRFRVPPAVRQTIYERDGWICQLCTEPVDPSLGPTDLWGATLDHIECQAWALIPDHSPENLRLAHRWCNSVRSDETYYTAADLVA